MRVKVNKCNQVFDKANEDDQIVEIIHKKKTLKMRIINVILSTGETEKLVTNIMDEKLTNERLQETIF